MRSYWRGALGSLVLQIWPTLVRFFFWFSHFKRETAVFRFWCLARFAGFVQFSIWFLVFVNNDGGFSLILLFRARRFSFFPFLARSLFAGYRFFCPMHFTVVLVLPRKLYPTVALKLQFLGPLIWRSTLSFRGIDDMPSLFSSRYLGRNGCQADYEKLKITSKRKTIGDFHMMSLKFKATKLSIDPAEILLSRDV